MLKGHLLTYEHADGRVQFSNLKFNIGEGRHALVGANGIGKSILAQVLAGLLAPTSGELKCSGRVYYFSQTAEPVDTTVGEYLLALWEASVERQVLINRLLGDVQMDQRLQNLSGGEWMRVRLSHALLQSWQFIIFDEPTNNLDTQARNLIADLLAQADFSFLLISHDRQMLRQVECIYELSSKGLQLYGGNYDFYRHQRQLERQRGAEQVQAAELKNKKRQAEKHEKIQAQEKRTRVAEKKAPSMGLPKIIMGLRKRQAQKTASLLRVQEDEFVQESFENLRETIEDQKKEQLLYFELPETELAAGKILLKLQNFNLRFSENSNWLWRNDLNFTLQGPQRLALKGVNGSGKSTLLKTLLRKGSEHPVLRRGLAEFADLPLVYLDQNYSGLNLEASVLENVFETSRFDLVETRNLMARFLFQKEQVHQLARTLSGGERMRASLAKALLGAQPPKILILDEPTNNLDLESIQFLENLLKAFKGALIVVSHDQDFLLNVGCELELVLESPNH